MHDIIPIFLKLVRLALCPIMWSILEKVPCSPEKNVYSVFIGREVLQMSAQSICSIVCVSSVGSLVLVLFICLLVLMVC